MTREEAIWILDPVTTEGALAEIRHCAVFNGDFAVKKAIADARILAVDALREQEQRRWIPVTERLPEIGIVVLVYSEDDGICADYYGGDSFGYYDVTHWMPLPEPPKENDHG